MLLSLIVMQKERGRNGESKFEHAVGEWLPQFKVGRTDLRAVYRLLFRPATLLYKQLITPMIALRKLKTQLLV